MMLAVPKAACARIINQFLVAGFSLFDELSARLCARCYLLPRHPEGVTGLYVVVQSVWDDHCILRRRRRCREHHTD